jgi:hypothetical protein
MVMHGGGGAMALVRLSGVPGVSAVVETATNFGVRSWATPPNAVQPGTTVLLDTNDARVLSAAWQNNSLVLAGNEGCTPSGDLSARSCLRIVELRTDTVTVLQDMTFGALGVYYFFPALRPDTAGNLYVVFTASSLTAFASVRVTARQVNDPLNTLQASIELRAGAGAQLEENAPGTTRFGDYAGAAVDPSDPSAVWVIGEYSASSGARTWGTWVAKLNFRPSIQAAVLPLSRSVQVKGARATGFAAIINTGATAAVNCAPVVIQNPPALGIFTYQTTTATNVLVGTPNTPANIAAGTIQNYVFGIFPADVLPETSVPMQFVCDNATAPQIPGVNNFLIVASNTPVPDTIALISTISNDGVIRIPGSTATQLFAIGTSNVGATGTIEVSADTGAAVLPLTLTVCETTGGPVCLAPPAATVTVDYATGTNRSFAFFAQASGPIPFDPAVNRVSVRLKEGGILRGATSAAVCTMPNAAC